MEFYKYSLKEEKSQIVDESLSVVSNSLQPHEL